MPTPPRPDWITAVSNSMLSPEGVPVAGPDWFATGRLGPSSMAIPYLSNRCRQHRATPLDRRTTVPSCLAGIAPLDDSRRGLRCRRVAGLELSKPITVAENDEACGHLI